MEYLNFGNAGLRVSRLALGLGFRGQNDEAEAQRVVERALDLGINLIDCANVYGLMDDRANVGLSEEILGRALRGKRDDVVITSKATSQIGPGPNDYGASRYHIMREVERSLRRLQTDRIDVYIVHYFDATTPLEETVRTLDDLVRSGKVRYIGCANYAAWQVCRALWVADSLHAIPFMCVQNEYNLLNRTMEREMLPMVRSQGLGFMAYSPLAIGLLSGMYTPGQPPPPNSFWSNQPAGQYQELMQGQTGTVISTLLELAAQLGKTPAQLATAWLLAQSEVTVAITGGDTIAHLEDNIGAVGWQLDAVIKEKLDTVSRSFL
ncbi:MAG: aldo/keto reductase [Anaerolineales bacterium]|nr:aldo/keto reductase [Anaerolineales bacterium]MCB0010256.1 aldo/keto reductase [Anaerolineales bacterium]MCB0016419.1 aldo/keto reductase [Anaerolineales bacterium]MCB0029029.1 aldo/keto reductase [Anaerolineales bacterium]MCB8959113.1 aldo/keto reductase [Ardenticatenales bacterium]